MEDCECNLIRPQQLNIRIKNSLCFSTQYATNKNVMSDQIFPLGKHVFWLKEFVLESRRLRHMTELPCLPHCNFKSRFPFYTGKLIGINPTHSKSRFVLPVDVTCSARSKSKVVVWQRKSFLYCWSHTDTKKEKTWCTVCLVSEPNMNINLTFILSYNINFYNIGCPVFTHSNCEKSL